MNLFSAIIFFIVGTSEKLSVRGEEEQLCVCVCVWCVSEQQRMKKRTAASHTLPHSQSPLFTAQYAQFTVSTSPGRGGRDVWLTLNPKTSGFAAISLSMIVPLPTPDGPAKKSAGGPSSSFAFAGDFGTGAEVSHDVRFPIF